MHIVIDALSQFSPAVTTAVIVTATVLSAFFVRVVVIGLLRRMTRHTRTTLDDQIFAALRMPIFVSVLLYGLWVLSSYAGMHGVFSGATRGMVLHVIESVAIIVWAICGFRIIRALLYKSKDAPRITIVQEQTVPLFENAAIVALIAAATYAIFSIWGINMTAWLASAGIIGMALGFAAKDTLANLFAGVFIIADRPYKIGDYIELDSGERGRVTHIGLRSTRLLRRDDVEVTIPNAVLGNTKIVNESGGPSERFRVRIAVGVAYGSDVDVVERELLAAAHDVALALDQPAPRARFVAFGESSLDYVLLFWVARPEQRGEARHHVNRAIYKRFAAAGIEIPFPQRDIHIHQT